MKLNDILSAYHTDPKESRKYAKEICSNLHGTVQKYGIQIYIVTDFSIYHFWK